MFGNFNRNAAYGNGKRKRLPVFSIALVLCYLAVAVLFFMYGFGDGRAAQEPAAEVVAVTPTPTPTPETTPEPEAPEPIPLPPPVKVKGIWVGAWFIVEEGLLDSYIELCETTEVNTLVFDIKEEHGYVTIPMESDVYPVSQNILIEDMGELIADLKSRDIYTIARVVCFKDSRRSARYPETAHRDSDGKVWQDARGYGWLNPYVRDNWDYIAELCLEAARLGFDEIQLDYVRFPVEGALSDIDSGRMDDERSRTEVIAEFVSFIRDTMLEVGVRTSADVFGIIGLSGTDSENVRLLGQDLDKLFSAVHYISPMIYPSHFANINQNGTGQVINGILFETPDKKPYEVIYNTLQHFIQRRDPNDPNKAIIRPYLQDFTAGYLGEGMYISYGPDEIRAQIDAVYAAGLDEWLLWSNTSNYTVETFTNP